MGGCCARLMLTTKVTKGPRQLKVSDDGFINGEEVVLCTTGQSGQQMHIR